MYMKKVFGFKKESEYLINNFKNNTLSNSIIISGQKGIGKSTFILNLVKEFFKFSINSTNLNHHLNLLNNKSHPNVKYISREIDEKSKKVKANINIDQIRKLNNFINESSFTDGLIKVIIVDGADDLNINASNSLLKILEEPNINTFIFLISHQLSSLLPTIRSRCLKIKCSNHDFATFQKILKSKFNDIDNEHLRFLFDISNGSPGYAIQFSDEEINDLFHEFATSLTSKKSLTNETIILSSKLAEFDNDKLKIIISILKFILLNLSKVKIGVNVLDLYISKKIKDTFSISEYISQQTIVKKLEYLIKNENDLFTYNLDKKNFMLNFFSEVE